MILRDNFFISPYLKYIATTLPYKIIQVRTPYSNVSILACMSLLFIPVDIFARA